MDHMVLLEVYNRLYNKYVLENDNVDDSIVMILNEIKDMYVDSLDDFEKYYGGTE